MRARCGGSDGIMTDPQNLSSFSALTLLVGSFDPEKNRPRDMTYNVFGGTSNLTQLQLYLSKDTII